MPLVKALLQRITAANFKSESRMAFIVRSFGRTGAVLLVLLLPVVLRAQGSFASLSGTVLDATGAAIPDAAVVLQNVDTKTTQATQSTQSGSFSLINVQPGNYTVRVTKTGFNVVEQTGLTLQVNQSASLNITLPVGGTEQTVDVNSQLSTVDSSTAELGTVVPEQSVKDLPLNGRNFTQLLTLTPGVSPVSVGQNSGGGGGFAGQAIGTFTFPSVGGQRNRSNMFLLDGVHDLAFIGNYNYSPIVDDIQEFKVQSHNDLAEFGQVAGGIINVASKAGSNTFHGTAWEFLRNEKLDARNYFEKTRNPLRQNQFGVTVGGPVIIPHLYHGRDKTFFFFAYEGFRQTQATQTILQAPTAAQLAGDLSGIVDSKGNPVHIYNPFSTRFDPALNSYVRDPFPNDRIPANLISPISALYAKTIFPTAGDPIAGQTGFNLADRTKAVSNANNFSGRIDQTFGTSDALFGRISHSNQPLSSSAGFPGALNTTNIDAWNIAVHEAHTFSPTTILDLTFGRNVGSAIVSTAYTTAPADFGNQLIGLGMNTKFLNQFLSTPATLIPKIGINGYIGTGGNNLQNTQLANTYQGNGDFTKILGRHTLKTGASYESNNFYGPIAGASLTFATNQTSTFQQQRDGAGNPIPSGNAVASFLLGVQSSAQRRDALETEHGGSVDGIYIQDQIKVTPNFSLNVGFRYDIAFWPAYGDLKSGQGYVGSMNLTNGTYVISATPPACSETVGAPCIPGGTLPANVVVTGNDNHGIHNTDYGNWQGRVGFAYKVNNTSAVRAGYSRFYDEWNGVAQFSQNVGGNWPSVGLLDSGQQNLNVINATISDPVNQGTSALFYPAATPFGNQTFYFNPDMRTPYTDQWNIGIDQELGKQATLSIAYAGSHGGRLDLGGIHNTARFPGLGDAAAVASRRQYPYIVPTFYDDSTGNSNYHALQTRLTSANHNGLTYLISYTWSKSIDLGSSGNFGAEGTNLQDPYNPQADRSVSGFDLTHIFSASAVYELPFGKGRRFNPGNGIVSYLAGGWQLNTIVNLASGAPYEVDVSGDNANTGNNFSHANRISGVNPYTTVDPRQRLNPAAFAIPDFGTFGNGGRNSLRQTPSKNLDLSVFRSFPIRDAVALTLRLESFNLTNTAIFSTPSTTLNDSNFGAVTSTRNTPRQLQVAAKINF